MKENKFIVIDGTDAMCIGGFGNDEGNKGLLKYTEKEIAKMIMENNNTTDNTRLANSLLRTIRNQDNIIKEAREYIDKWKFEVSDLEEPPLILNVIEIDKLLEILRGDKE